MLTLTLDRRHFSDSICRLGIKHSSCWWECKHCRPWFSPPAGEMVETSGGEALVPLSQFHYLIRLLRTINLNPPEIWGETFLLKLNTKICFLRPVWCTGTQILCSNSSNVGLLPPPPLEPFTKALPFTSCDRRRAVLLRAPPWATSSRSWMFSL